MRKEDILANCIDEVLAGRSTVENCLRRHPNLSDDLRSLLEIAGSIRPDDAVPTVDSIERIRSRLLRAMEPPPVRRREGKAGRAFSPLRLPAMAARLSLPALAGIALALLVAAGGTTAYASQSSLPGDILYPVKKGVESIQLVLTFSPEAKASLHLKLAQRRIDEVIAQSNLGEDISTATLSAIAAQIDSAVREIDRLLPEDAKALLGRLSESMLERQLALSRVLGESPEETQPALEEALGAARRGDLVAQAAYGNPEVLDTLPMVSDEELEASHFKLKGTLHSIDGDTWHVGGLVLDNVSAPQTPPAGTEVRLKGLALEGQVFVIEIDVKDKPSDRVEIEGVFRGTDPSGTVWNVAGISFSVAEGTKPPSPGDWIELKGVEKDGTLVISKVESEEREGAVGIEGLLKEVDGEAQTITVEIAGRRLAIGVGEALITDDGGQPLSLPQLETFLGSYVRVDGLHTVDGLLLADRVALDAELEEHSQEPEEEHEEEAEHDAGDGDRSDIHEEDEVGVDGDGHETDDADQEAPDAEHGQPDEADDEGDDCDCPPRD